MRFVTLNTLAVLPVSIFASFLLASCSGSDSETPVSAPEPETPVVSSAVFGECGSAAPLELPCGFPYPRESEDNPLSMEKVELGRLLFYDRNMSFNQTQSCADCHLQDKAFTDGLALSIGSQADVHARNAMSMTNVVYNSTMNWANPQIVNMHDQALAVVLNEDPVELGWAGHVDEILNRLKSPSNANYAGTSFAGHAPDYPQMFAEAFPNETDPITLSTVVKAFAAFGSIMISGDSEYDKENRGEANTMSEAAKRGRELFFGERLECFHCHGGFNFSDSVDHEGSTFTHNTFHNNALYNIDGDGDGIGDYLYPADNHGLREFTLLPEDEGKFRAPTLRNIELTAPYMHDGSIATLDEVIDHYSRGGREILPPDPNAGDGALNKNKSLFITGFVITADERLDLIEFFKSLTDWKFVCRDDLSNPFEDVPKHAMCP
ncbi:MAG: di-heme enzyme [Gammaproteobacteria bacterium]|nr:di-heme enzyme [Gammaproteobacteria bacterium]NNJ48753.1 di-heme enzyme [Gammaproteobacteria bacterium]